MKLSTIFLYQLLFIFLEYSLVNSLKFVPYYEIEQSYEPIQYVDFDLISGDQPELSKTRYDMIDNNGEMSSNLPLLSRGIREIETSDDFEDNVKVPSCSELKKMWKIARRIHHHAIKTNEIPQKLHPFSHFESDRFRTSRRLNKNRSTKNRENKNSKTSKASPDGSKETAEANYGLVRYAPSDPVKRPGGKVYDVLRQLHPETDYGEVKDSGSWTTKIVNFEPENQSRGAFDTLRNKLRQEKKLPPMPEKSRQKDYWGKIITHYKNKNKVKSNLDRVRDELLSSSHRSEGKVSRLNYRDDSSGPIQSGRDTTFGNLWNSRKSNKQKLNRKQRKKKRKHSGRKKFRNSRNRLQNFLMKGQL